jgi:peptide/nickel transport system substrate-binding protein
MERSEKMKGKILWLGAVFFLIAAMLLSSCTTKSTTINATTPAVQTPQYGGTLNVFTAQAATNPTGWDHPMASNMAGGAIWGNPYLEMLVTGDVEKYGPNGTNQFAFNLYEGVPESYLGGGLASSWEINVGPPLTYTWHLRKGVMWTGNTNIGMASRELTADDVVFSEKRAKARPGFESSMAWLANVSAPDKYTVVWECSSFYNRWAWRMGGTVIGQIWAHESVDAGPNDWRNAVGTGPFILTDYIEGSAATYSRNPKYWGTTTINGKVYQEPFIDKLTYSIIPDESTQIAAVRTGKIDWDPKVALTYQQTLASTTPNLIQAKYLNNTIDIMAFNRANADSVLSNLKIRRALMIGTDLQAIANLVYNGGVVYTWPVTPGGEGFIPQDQLPASQKELWTYDPVKAKQMIADAGYPNGFPILIELGPVDSQQQVAEVLVSMWAKIGVKVTIKTVDTAALATLRANGTWKDCTFQSSTVVSLLTSLGYASATGSMVTYRANDPLGFDAMFKQASAEVDPVKRVAELKVLSLGMMDDAARIAFANPYVLNCYWPWMKNYFGEIDASYYNQMPMIKRMWIDQNLKTSLTK